MTTRALGLLLLFALASPVAAQVDAMVPAPLAELRGMGPEARAAWPALARLVDDAAALARRGGDVDDDRVRRARYTFFGATASQARADWQAITEALDALRLLERSATARGAKLSDFRAAHLQLRRAVHEGFAGRTRRGDVVPRLPDPDALGLPYAALLPGFPRTNVTFFGIVPSAVYLARELARGATVGTALGADFARTLAQAEAGEAYAVVGASTRTGAYRGGALLELRDARPRLTYRREGKPVLRGPLERRGRTWVLDLRGVATPGLAGALSGVDARDLRYIAIYTPVEPGTLSGSWRLLRERRGAPDEELDAGQETLTRASPSLGVAESLAMSSLMAKIVAACREVAGQGTVPAELMLTTRNVAVEQALVRGPAIFTAVERLIEGAEEEVLVQTYNWTMSSQASERFLRALSALDAKGPRRAPIRVRVVINGHRFQSSANVDALKRAVARLALDPRRVDVRIERHTFWGMGALHTKLVVVDGAAAVIGGANFTSINDAGPRTWFDTAYELHGDVARALRADFVDIWAQLTDERLRARPAAPAAGTIPMLVATRRPDGNPFANDANDPQGRALVAGIDGSRQRIRIITPNLNDDVIKGALLRALRRGVRVELVTSLRFGESNEELPLQGGGNEENVRELYAALDAAARDRLDVRWFAATPGVPVSGDTDGASHTKYASFDGQVVMVGSYNLDTQSMNHSREVNVVVDDAATVAAWDAAVFEPPFAIGVPAGR
jgi:phosphatidylserine/phosphatidylglycerophosphate/cardiolipin synthase-like enzyme